MLSPEFNPAACIEKFTNVLLERIHAEQAAAETKAWTQENGLMPVCTTSGQRSGCSFTYR